MYSYLFKILCGCCTLLHLCSMHIEIATYIASVKPQYFTSIKFYNLRIQLVTLKAAAEDELLFNKLAFCQFTNLVILFWCCTSGAVNSPSVYEDFGPTHSCLQVNRQVNSANCLVPKNNHQISELTKDQFVEEKLMLSCSFRCGQQYDNHSYDFGHTLLCYLSLTQMLNKPTSENQMVCLCSVYVQPILHKISLS